MSVGAIELLVAGGPPDDQLMLSVEFKSSGEIQVTRKIGTSEISATSHNKAIQEYMQGLDLNSVPEFVGTEAKFAPDSLTGTVRIRVGNEVMVVHYPLMQRPSAKDDISQILALAPDTPSLLTRELHQTLLEVGLRSLAVGAGDKMLFQNGGWGRLTNDTGETLLVYGPKRANEPMDNSLYFLPAGRRTPDNWDCDGFYVPNDRVADQVFTNPSGPLAIKYINGRFPVIETDSSEPTWYECGANNGAYAPGQIHWEIPNLPYGSLPGRYPEVPNHLSA